MCFIAHFGPAGVTAAKLRRLGVLRGKILTSFHGIDISAAKCSVVHYTPGMRQLFRRRSDAAHQRSVGRSPEKYGLSAGKIAVSRMGVDMTRLPIVSEARGCRWR